MRVSGFTFLRNAVKLDYPAVEAIRSVLPLVDEFVVNVGRLPGEADDGTLGMVRDIGSPKLRIIESLWSPQMNRGAYVYAQQTNIALFNCTGDWAVYVQCDEVVHEGDHDLLRDAMQRYMDDARVDALTLHQLNFWGDYQTILHRRPWIGRRKCWIVKPHHFVLSRGDAANFTVHPKFKERGRKVRAVETAARQFHYGAIKSGKALREKEANNAKFWTERRFDVEKATEATFYHQVPKQFVCRFDGSHPAVMSQRIAEHEISLDHDSPNWRSNLTGKERWQVIKGWLVDHTTDRFTGRGDYRLVGTHSKPADVVELAKGH